MKRKKWSEVEEQTLLDKYSDLLTTGTLSRLKTREKKFRPIADHVNSLHHLQDPHKFPFKWTWRDVSIKVQNMRHQYLGVKQKIRVSPDEFNWRDGENYWENFLKYKEVFGDVELEVKDKKDDKNKSKKKKKKKNARDGFLDGIESSEDLGDAEEEDEEEAEEEEEEEENEGDDEEEEDEKREGAEGIGFGEGDGSGNGDKGPEFEGNEGNGEKGISRKGKRKKLFGGRKRRLGLLASKVLDLRDVVMRREERRREREFSREKCRVESEGKRREMELRRELRWTEKEERMENWEMELEEREWNWAKREFERRVTVERELDEERRKRKFLEEKREEEEMEWRERMVAMQIEHEKAMMQLHADACQNQMQILGVMARLICQFFGPANDGLGAALGGLPPQVLQNLQHHGGLGDNGKPDSSSPSEFI